MKEINEVDFEKSVSSGVTLVDFFATWCGPCKMQAIVLEELEESGQGFNIIKVDVDKNPNLARKFSVMSIPTLVFMKDGEMVHRHVGLMQEDELSEILKSFE